MVTPPNATLEEVSDLHAENNVRAVFDSKTPCQHCGLPLGLGWKREYGAFCCHGCRAVHDLLLQSGLDRYYDLKRGPTAPPPRLRPDGFAWLERLLEAAPEETAEEAARTTRRITLDVQGIHCAACVWLLEQLFRREPGALDIRINPMQGKAEICWLPAQLDLAAYLRHAERFGYRFGPDRKHAPFASRALVLRLYICLAAAVNAQVFAVCRYVGLGPEHAALFKLFGILELALGTVALVVGGSYFVRRALLSLRAGVVHLDLPIALGLVLAYTGSLSAFLLHGSEVAYFDTVATFIALMLLGRWMQERVLEKNRRALLDAEELDQLTTRRRTQGHLEAVALSALNCGDELWILPGELIPLAGLALDEHARIALDWITGESKQREVLRGEALPAGAFNAARSALRMEATETFSTSRLQGLLGSTTQAGADRDRRWDLIARIYVGLVLFLAASGFALWFATSGFDQALSVAVAILVVTCPCALGLAAPLAQELVQSSLRRRGIFVRQAGFFSRALRVKQVLFDKTGTLSSGALELDPASSAELDRLSASDRYALHELVTRSLHPVSRALAAALDATSALTPNTALRVIEVPGRGLEGTIDAVCYRLGKASFAAPTADCAALRGDTVFTRDGSVCARFRFHEQLEGDAAQELDALQAAGYRVRVLSGDTSERVNAAAAALGLSSELAESALSPEDKAERIRALDQHDTLMVGDGLNDAPAFDAAWCSATPAIDRPQLPGKADFYFLGGGIAAVRRALLAARGLQSATRTALIFAVLYNALAVSACLLGWVSPISAAISMPLSSLALVLWTTFAIQRRSAQWTC